MALKKLIVGWIIFSMMFGISFGFVIPANENAKENSKAVNNSRAFGDDWLISKTFEHPAKPDKPSGKPNKPPKTPTCYDTMGVKWKDTPFNLVINPNVPIGVNSNFFINTTINSAMTWDVETGTNLFGNFLVDESATYRDQNFVNTVSFGDYSSGTIGVTTIWYTRRGKEIVEFDILLNTDYDWGDASIDGTLMDIENIMTHELGHGLGMEDIYNDACSDVTMYGYSYEGDIAKRTLEIPDITGLIEMYG